MSGIVSFYWCDDDGDPHYVRIPRDEVRAVRFARDEIEVQLVDAYQDINISTDPTSEMDRDIERKFAVKMIDSIRSSTDENVSWEFDGKAWAKLKSKDESVWSRQ